MYDPEKFPHSAKYGLVWSEPGKTVQTFKWFFTPEERDDYFGKNLLHKAVKYLNPREES